MNKFLAIPPTLNYPGYDQQTWIDPARVFEISMSFSDYSSNGTFVLVAQIRYGVHECYGPKLFAYDDSSVGDCVAFIAPWVDAAEHPIVKKARAYFAEQAAIAKATGDTTKGGANGEG